MNALNNAASDIVNLYIPMEVLELAFPNEGVILSLEERLINKCLRPIIMKDMNLLGGVITYIDFKSCEIIASKEHDTGFNPNTAELIIRVPKTLTNDKSIISVMYLMSGIGTYPIPKPCVPKSMIESVKMLGTIDTPNVISTSRLEVVGENLILIAGTRSSITRATLAVTVENNDNLENIQAPYFKQVVDIMVKGVKAHIYNKLIIKLNKGYIYGGHELSIVKDIVESYSDMNEEYREALLKWKKISLMSDSRFMDQYIKSMLGVTI